MLHLLDDADWTMRIRAMKGLATLHDAVLAPLLAKIVHVMCTDEHNLVRDIAWGALSACDGASLMPHAATIREQAASNPEMPWKTRPILDKIGAPDHPWCEYVFPSGVRCVKDRDEGSQYCSHCKSLVELSRLIETVSRARDRRLVLYVCMCVCIYVCIFA